MNDVYFQHEQRSDMNNKRNAGMSKGEIMNRLATSKEDILAASRELIKENGWAAVSIRSVAAKCSVSAGTIYNYYESKAELLGALPSRASGRKSFFTRKTSRYFMMLQLAFHGFMNGSNMAISGFRDFSLYIPLVL